VLLAALGAAGLLLSSCARREPTKGAFVDDQAALLSDAAEANIDHWHAALLGQYDIDYRVLTVTGSDDLSALAVHHFEDEGVGNLSSTGRGLLLVVDAGRERVRLEVARELEGVFVDAFVAFIEREQMAPFFAAGRVGDGILAASELIAGRAEETLEPAVLVERGAEASSAGAGAEAAAGVGTGYERPTARVAIEARATAAPLDTVMAYLDAMTVYDGSPGLDLYTPDTRAMMGRHVVTRAQMDNLVRTYRACGQPRVREQDDFAVVDYPDDSGRCSPWFLARSADGLWRLDLLTMQSVVRFDTGNRWHIAVPEALGAYAFAFDR
jgi:uncharacterized protein